jgi:hypothetical protein
VVQRVGPGLYRRAVPTTPTLELAVPLAADLPPVADEPVGLSDVVLIGCVKSKLARAAPARDLYTSALFTRRRRYAEATGLPWFVVSSRWGLVAPDEVVSPYDVYLGDRSAAYRRTWAEFVTAQLSDLGSLTGTVVEIHAGDYYVNALRPALEHAGAVVVDAVDAASMGETLAWYDRHRPIAPATADRLDITTLVNYLSDSTRTVSPAELRASSRAALSSPGLYSWWVDDAGADDLSRALSAPVRPGLVYAGLAGATRWPSGKSSSNTLWGRLVDMHLGGRANLSTFRTSLGAILSATLWSGALDESRLTQWMDQHLRVIALPVDDADSLGVVETRVLHHLDPPLNLSKMATTPLRTEVSRLRRAMRA